MIVFSSCADIATLHQGTESLSSWKASAAEVRSSVCVVHQYVFHLFANACGVVFVLALISGTF